MKARKALESLGYIQVPAGKELDCEVGDLVLHREGQDFDNVAWVYCIVATGYRPYTRRGGEVYHVLLYTGAARAPEKQDDLEIVSEYNIVKQPLYFPDQTLLVPIGEATIKLTVTDIKVTSGTWEYTFQGTEEN